MAVDNILYTIISGTVCLLLVVLFFLARRHSHDSGAEVRYYQQACAALFVWAFFDMAQFVIPDPQLALRYARFCFIGVAFMPVALFMHIWQQFTQKEVSRLHIFLCYIPAFISSFFIVTNEKLHLFYHSGDFPYYPLRWAQFDWAGGFYFHWVFSYGFVLAAIIYLLKIFFLVPPNMRGSIQLMLLGSLLTVLVNIPVTTKLIRVPLDLSIVSGGLTFLFHYWAFQKNPSASVVITSRAYIYKRLTSMIFVLDPNRTILDNNDNGRDKLLELGLPQYGGSFDGFIRRWTQRENGRISPYNPEILSLVRAGQETHYNMITDEIYTKSQSIQGYIIEILDITKIYTLQRMIENTALYDQLTGVYNRNTYLHSIAELSAAENLPLAVVVGDIDRLKSANDKLGHLVGDTLLVDAVEVLRECLPKGAFLARIGGDEFFVGIKRSSREQAEQFIEAVDQTCAQKQVRPYGELHISMGYSLLEDAAGDFEAVFTQADENMYRKKKGHKEAPFCRPFETPLAANTDKKI
ncbi:diguanylate cyclase [Oscillospiraceae bacterium MB08-C2-2]|nr:diguanylate cyclase [Oscillospiraceae bacterium MB08-C2-2]